MSDLIRRSGLLEELKSLKIVLNGKQIFSDDAKDTVLRIVNEQPTAYDVDKVVEELEEWTFNADVNIGDGTTMNHNLIESKNAIEIVKQGVVSDDVCEWRLCDEEANVYDTSCRNPHILIEGTPEENNYKFCPYCGKKITIVGD